MRSATDATPATGPGPGAGAAPVLEAVDVSMHFTVRSRIGRTSTVRALEHTSLRLHRGKIVALVGESGSGKTTLARLFSLMYRPTSGEIRLRGEPVGPLRGKAARAYYSDVQMVFQDPFASLNTMHTVRHTLGRALRLHGHGRGKDALEAHILDLLQRVSLTPTRDFVDKLPHELSGGQRQRVAIARALAVGPKVVLGDEPISMLDVSMRLDILNLLAQLRDEEDLALLYITHDIASARYLAEEIYVMYAGQMVEGGPTEEVIQNPQHPYTRLLLGASPDPARTLTRTGASAFTDVADAGEPPDLADPPSGCRFHPRCPFARESCRAEFPARTSHATGQWVHCWLHPADEQE
ncbi:ABC transporter ATP-binding protein [Streptomyces sp. WMMC500]|uniref:ABC transporter ATP-binding protein n=1 Tax=Streptomyces sp. WMMC500 TaxID=3015154 RepID=UPI00248CFFFD|nr:ABC transporter ATP-binding protein [Streptomyces sp. WMMC500]WBB57659.1 ABC transporter ATP-binding protein [Streptomyces sp. WMMC500]